MKPRRTTKELIEDAAVAYSDLNMFAAVQALMENSLVSTPRFATEGRIVKLCKNEQQRCLRDYDRAMAKLSADREGR